MTAVISPPMFLQFFSTSGTGAPLAGGKLFVYLAGTSTKTSTWTDSTQGTLNANPITLDSQGRATVWLDPLLGPVKYVLAPANDTDPPTSPLYSQDNISVGQQPLYLITPSEQAAGVSVVNSQYQTCHVDRYGTNSTPGTTDMTSAFQAAINVARQSSGGGVVYWGETITYLVTSTLVLSTFTLNPVNLQCSAPAWFNAPSTTPTITSSISGALLSCAGDSLAHLASAPKIYGGILKNSSTNAAASVVDVSYTAGPRLEYCWLLGGNYGVYSSIYCISPEFHNVHVSSTAGTMVACYKGDYWNAAWICGRAFSALYAFDITGTTLGFLDFDVEFCEVIVRHQAMSGMVFENCHFESSQILLTNATTVPINTSGNYTDNASEGTGISGIVKFIGGTVALTNTHSNIVVIKSQASFIYFLEFDGVFVTATNPLVGNSFAPGSGVALPAGTKIITRNCIGLTVQKPAADAFSGHLLENSTSGAVSMDSTFSSLKTSYSPTWAATGTQPSLGNGTLTASYARMNACVYFNIKLTMGSTTTTGTGSWTFSLPIASSLDCVCGSAFGIDAGTQNYIGVSRITSGVVQLWSNAAASLAFGQTVPFTWGSTDSVEISGIYFI